jgi:metal-responsive CopG/Arc/MetJ family transcriptional regulator
MASDNETVCVRFEKGDFVLLEALVEKERLKRSDIIRRAVRAYAEQLGVVPKKKR